MKPVLVQKNTFFSFDETEIYYEAHGDHGPAIVLIYGVACQMNHWIYQVASLSKKFRVILFDYRGHHKSATSEVLNMDVVAKDVNALLNHLKIDKANLVGHSFGVPVAVKFATQFPQQTSSLVLINGFVYNPLDELFRFPVSKKLIDSIELLEGSAPKLSQWLWEKSVNNLLAQIVSGLLGGFNLELISFKDIEIYTQALENLQLKVVLEYMKDLVSTDLRDDLKQITAPTLIISGQRDGITPVHQQDLMHNLISESQIVKIKDGSHCTQLDKPELVSDLIDQFIVMHNQK